MRCRSHHDVLRAVSPPSLPPRPLLVFGGSPLAAICTVCSPVRLEGSPAAVSRPGVVKRAAALARPPASRALCLWRLRCRFAVMGCLLRLAQGPG